MNKENVSYLLKTSFELANEAIFLINKYGDLIFVNSAACKHLNYSNDELTKLKVWDVDIHHDSNEKYQERLSEFLSLDTTEAIKMTSAHRKKTGEEIPVEITSRIITIDDEKYILSFVEDISNEVKLNEKLSLYFELIKTSNDLIFIVDFNTQLIEFVNDKVCSTLGYTFEEMREKSIGDIRKTLDNNIKLSEVFEKIKEAKKLTTIGQYLCKDGSFISVETSLTFKTIENKDYILAISRDISERLELEKKKEEYNKTLTLEIEKAKNELTEYEQIMHKQSKMAAMGEMLENIAHQWRQPLSVISVLSTGMKLKNHNSILDKGELDKGLNDINISSQYLSDTIESFTNYFKPDDNKSEFYLDELIDYTSELINTKFLDSHIEIIKNIERIKLNTFKNELIQVIINILNNAVDELSSQNKDKKYIFINCIQDEKNIYISIKDNAGGIRSNIINRVFEPYFSTKHKSKGTGIGLYMSQEIIKKHIQGDIEVKNESYIYKDESYKGANFLISINK